MVGNTVLILLAIQIKSDMGLSVSCWLHVRCGQKHTAVQSERQVSVISSHPTRQTHSIRHTGLARPPYQTGSPTKLPETPWPLSIAVFQFSYFVLRKGPHFINYILSNTTGGFMLSENRSYVGLLSNRIR